MLATAPDFDVLIVGAGISGIGMAAHMEMHCPSRSYAIVERRENLGGTWDLFRYPGIRSDSDMHTLGFVFEPWRHEKSIADAPSILEYLNRIVDERGIRQHIRYQHKVISADWHSDEARWHVTMEKADGSQTVMTANFVYLGSGYYDYDEPYDPGFEFADFDGQVIHPQFWPEDLDYSGKKVVVIGSGRCITGAEVAIALGLGADLVHIARGFMLALGCIQALQCDSNHCPTGVATNNKWLVRGLVPSSKDVRVANYMEAIHHDVMMIARALGVTHPREILRHHMSMIVEPGRRVSLTEIYPSTMKAFHETRVIRREKMPAA